MDPVAEHWLREWGVPVRPDHGDLVSALDGAAAAAAAPSPEPDPAVPPDAFEPFGPGEMAVFARIADDRGAADLGAELAAALTGVALLQDETHADGIAQWVLGQSSRAGGT